MCCSWMSPSRPLMLRHATCCTMNWNESGPRPGKPSCSSPTMSGRRSGWEIELWRSATVRDALHIRWKYLCLARVILKMPRSPLSPERFCNTCAGKSTNRSALSTAMNKIIRQLGFYVALIGLWQIVAMLKLWQPYLFPTPWNVVEALRAGFADHTFWTGMAVSLKRMVIGYLLACVMGILLGIVLAQSRFLAETLGRLVVSIQSLPSVCWLPVAILWFGLTEKAIIFVVVIGSLLAVAISVETGLRNVPRIYLMAGRNLGATRVDLLLHVFLPASLPHLVAGL